MNADDPRPDDLTGGDAELLDRLQAMWETNDPMPAGLVERVIFAIGLDDLDVEMMRLTEEILVPAGARGAEHVRTITFGGDSITVMVTVSQERPDSFRLDGWLAPAAALSIELRRTDGLGVRELGRGRPVRLRERAAGPGPAGPAPDAQLRGGAAPGRRRPRRTALTLAGSRRLLSWRRTGAAGQEVGSEEADGQGDEYAERRCRPRTRPCRRSRTGTGSPPS